MSQFCGDPYYPPCVGCPRCTVGLQHEDYTPTHTQEAPAEQVQPIVETSEYEPEGGESDPTGEDIVWTDIHIDNRSVVPEVHTLEDPEPGHDNNPVGDFGEDTSGDWETRREPYDVSEDDASEDDNLMGQDEAEEESDEHLEPGPVEPATAATPAYSRHVIIRRRDQPLPPPMYQEVTASTSRTREFVGYTRRRDFQMEDLTDELNRALAEIWRLRRMETTFHQQYASQEARIVDALEQAQAASRTIAQLLVRLYRRPGL